MMRYLRVFLYTPPGATGYRCQALPVIEREVEMSDEAQGWAGGSPVRVYEAGNPQDAIDLDLNPLLQDDAAWETTIANLVNDNGFRVVYDRWANGDNLNPRRTFQVWKAFGIKSLDLDDSVPYGLGSNDVAGGGTNWPNY